jgi:hypothetical protein
MSHPALPAADAAFADALSQSARGPERDGVFALWLVTRAALAAAPPIAPPARRPQHLAALARRLRSLTVSSPLRRSLSAALADLARAASPAVVLSHMVAPASECCGRPAAEALAAASRAARVAPAAPPAPTAPGRAA